jgi:hypothetical protein
MKPEHTEHAPAIGLAQQIILYAKHQYGSSGDEIADIRTLMSLYSGTEEHFISDGSVREQIIDAFVNYVSHPHYLKEAIVDALGWGFMAHLHQEHGAKPEHFFLSKLAIIKGKFVDLSKKFPNISFHEAEFEEVTGEEKLLTS